MWDKLLPFWMKNMGVNTFFVLFLSALLIVSARGDEGK